MPSIERLFVRFPRVLPSPFVGSAFWLLGVGWLRLAWGVLVFERRYVKAFRNALPISTRKAGGTALSRWARCSAACMANGAARAKPAGIRALSANMTPFVGAAGVMFARAAQEQSAGLPDAIGRHCPHLAVAYKNGKLARCAGRSAIWMPGQLPTFARNAWRPLQQ